MQLVCDMNGVVKYAFKDTEILRWEGGYLSFPVRALDIKQDTHTIKVTDDVPEDFKGSLYSYHDEDGWSYARAFTDEEVAEMTAKKVEYFESQIQAKLDSEAQAKGYENILSACTYASYTNPFQAEGQAFVEWRGNVWAYLYGVLNDVQSGARAEPTIGELLAEIPQLVLR